MSMRRHNAILSMALLALAACGVDDPRDRLEDEPDRANLQDLPHRTVVPHVGAYPNDSDPRIEGQTHTLHVTNPSGDVVRYSTGDGTQFLQPHATDQLELPAESGPVFIDSSAPVAAMMVGSLNGGASSFAFPGVFAGDLQHSQRFCPELSGRGSEQRTILGLTNPGDTATTATVVFQGRSGLNFEEPHVSIPARATTFLDVRELAGDRGDANWLGSAVVHGNDSVLATVTKINNNDTSTAYHCPAGGSRTLSVPEYKRKNSGSWDQWNVLAVQNVALEPANVTVTFAEGDLELRHDVVLDPGQSHAFNSRFHDELAALGDSFNGAVTIESDRDVVALNTVRISDSGGFIPRRDRAGQYRVPTGLEAARSLVFPSIHKLGVGGNERYGHVNLLNPHRVPVQATVTFRDQGGGTVFEQTVSIPARSTEWWNTAFKNKGDIPDGFEGSVHVEADAPIFGVVQHLSSNDQLNMPAIALGLDDTLRAGTAGQTLYGGEGSDRLFGEAGSDTLLGGAQGDMLLGGEGDDTLEGEGGPDLLNGGPGNDTIRGGAGDDYYVVSSGEGDDVIEDGSGAHDRLTIHGVSPTSVTEERDGNDLVLRLPVGSVRIRDHYGAGAIELVDYEYGQDSFDELDYGIHWFGPTNQREKYVPTIANQYFDPDRPTLILAHGWQPNSIPARSRRGLNYRGAEAPDIDLADAWIAAGWNVGMFYWQNFADEATVDDAEGKLWSADGNQGLGMRWRRADGSYSAGPDGWSVGDLARQGVSAALLEGRSPTVRIAGHSLGNQLASIVAGGLSDAVEADEVSARLRPERLSLLDPYWSKGAKDYLGAGETTAMRTLDNVRGLLDTGVPVDAYRSSAVLFGGDANVGLFDEVCLVELRPHYFPFGDVELKHMVGLWHYVLGFSFENFDDRGDRVASSNTSADDLWRCAEGGFSWTHNGGTSTKTPGDDDYLRTGG